MRALLLAICLSVPAAAFDCPEGQRLQVDLRAWKASLKAAAPGSPGQRQALRALGLAEVPSGSGAIPGDACARKPSLDALDDLDSKLTGEGDRTLHARFSMCSGGQRFLSQRIAVVVPLAGGGLCKLDGDDLSRDQLASDSACRRKRPEAPRTLRLARLTAPSRNVLQIEDQNGDCNGQGVLRLVLYEAHGAALERIFENKLWESAAGEETSWKLVFGPTLPKTISVTRETRCRKGAKCTPGSDSQRYLYSAESAAYVRAGEMQ